MSTCFADPVFEILMLGLYDDQSYFGKSKFPVDVFQIIIGEVMSLNSLYLRIEVDEKCDPSTFRLSFSRLDELGIFRGDTCEISCFNCQERSPKTYLVALSDESIQNNTVVISKTLADSLKSRMNSTRLFACRVSLVPDMGYGKNVYFEHYESGEKFDSHLKPFFLEAYRPVCIGDCFLLDGISFKVAHAEPNPCIVSPETIIFERSTAL